MALLSDYTAGTVTSSGNVITGTGTAWAVAEFREGDVFTADGWSVIIASVDSDTQLTVDPNRGIVGAVLSGAEYGLRYMSDGSRASAQARQLIDMLGNSGTLEGLSTISGLPNTLIMFTGPGSAVLIPKSDLISGADYDVQVADIAGRGIYDGQPEGFRVLVSDVGDGRSAIYSRVGSVGNWSVPAYVTGPVGPMPTLEAGTTATLAPGEDATFDVRPVVGGYEIDTGIPAGEGFYWQHEYDPLLAYAKDDVVRHNGSAFIAVQAVAIGEAPSSAAPPIDTSFWEVVASKGADGMGTGDVVGPAVAVADRIAAFDGATGKLIKDSGVDISAVIRSDEQSLTPDQQAQALANIGAGTFRWNWIVNGDFTVNMRGAATKAQAVGVYGYDRWKGHANGLEQVIEALPADTYTLAWTGGGTGTFAGTAAASPFKATTVGGNVSVVVPATATRVSLVAGDATAVGDPFSPRDIQHELALCRRYYRLGADQFGYTRSGAELVRFAAYEFEMRAAPTVNWTSRVNAVDIVGGDTALLTDRGCTLFSSVPADTDYIYFTNVRFDAEF